MSKMKKDLKNRSSERGGAGVKFLLVLLVLFLIGNAGYHFIPVAYAGESLKQDMQTAVVQGLAAPGRGSPVDLVKRKILISAESNNIPQDVIVEVKAVNNIVQAHVAYTKEVPVLPFGIYNYQYEFDHTATPAGFLTKQ
jgi:hypothetical protein